jgi:hypothetical protein
MHTMLRPVAIALSLGVLSAGATATPHCVHSGNNGILEGYVVGIASSRADNANGWAIWLSDKPYFDDTALRVSADVGGRLDISKDLGRLNYSMVMNAMNMGYMVDVLDLFGTQRCDDFQVVEISNGDID